MIAVPSLGLVHWKFVASLIGVLCHEIEGVKLDLVPLLDSMTYTARIELSDMAIKGEYDYVLWMDSEMVIPKDALKKMLDADRDMVTGLYFQRRGNHEPVIYSGVDVNDRIVYENYPKDKLFRVAACGFGCVLMKTEVIRQVSKASDGATFQPFTGIGEDLSFCYRWRRSGGVIWCDPTIKCGHIGESVFTEEDWENGRA
jgi:GT2 family glycosyltransferase